MFNLKEKVKDKIKLSYWQGGASIYKDGLISDISLIGYENTLFFSAKIKGNYNNYYKAEISLKKEYLEIDYKCECPAFGFTIGCKHIAGLSRKIEREYDILDNFSVRNKKNIEIEKFNKEENLSEETGLSHELYESLKNDNNKLKRFLNEVMGFSDIYGMPGFMFEELRLKVLTEMKKIVKPKNNESKFKIFSGLSSSNKSNSSNLEEKKLLEEEIKEEKLYKFKLDFFVKEPGYGDYKDEYSIELCLHKGKILKNGNLSTGAKVFRKNINSFPKKYKKHAQFLKYSNGNSFYYSENETKNIDFTDAPEIFMSNLFSIKEDIFNLKNSNKLDIKKEIYDLKILTQKTQKNKKDKKNNYIISLSLESNSEKDTLLKNESKSKNKNIILKSYKIIGDKESEYLAGLSRKNKLYFFKTDLPFDFINTLNKNRLVLTEEEFNDLKKSDYFSSILEHSSDIEVLGLEKQTGIPELELGVTIDKDFENIEISKKIIYKLNSREYFIDKNNYKTKEFFVGENNTLIQRDKNLEKECLNKLEKLEYLGDDFTVSHTNSLHLDNIYKNIDLEEESNKAHPQPFPLKKGRELEENNLNNKVGDDCNRSLQEAKNTVDLFFDEIEKLIESGIKVNYKQKTKRVSSEKVGINIKIKSGVDFFDTMTTLTLGDKELKEHADFLKLLGSNKNKKSITLKNGMTVLIKDDLDKTFELLEDMGISKKDIGKEKAISKHNIGLLKENKLKEDILQFKLDKETIALKKSLSNFNGIKKIKLPDNINADLRDYQKIGFNWMNFLEKYNFSGILADDMGLGKTLQTLAMLQKIYNKKEFKTKSLVICPTSLVYNWLDEAQKFTPDLRVEHITDSKRGFDNIAKDTQVVLVSYGIISNLVELNKIPNKFHYLILDESQNIKNPLAKRTKSICKIKASYRLALSGTPIENNLVELWSGFNFLMPGFLGTLGKFKSKYMGKDFNKEDLKFLSQKVKPFILRRTKEEVLKELPAKQEEIIKLEMGPKQRAFYIKLKNTFKLQITKELAEKGLNKSRFKVLDALLKLRQVCLTPELIPMKENSNTEVPSESIKLKYIEENIEDMITSGHNLLIFSQFTGFLKYVRKILEKKNIDYNYIDGKVKSKDRQELVKEFNTGKKNVFVISLKAGGTGLNLTKADYVIHLDPWWNPAVENQATDRAHRMGQKKTVFVQKLICKDSIEEKILELQEKKKKLIDDVFSGNFSGSLDKEDIDFIFE